MPHTSTQWFRIDEVLPLAEHAVACPDHRLTTAQVRAGARRRPALVWTHAPDEDTLTSNGVPVWYDADGEVHAAAAWTWRNSATAAHRRSERHALVRPGPRRRGRSRTVPL